MVFTDGSNNINELGDNSAQWNQVTLGTSTVSTAGEATTVSTLMYPSTAEATNADGHFKIVAGINLSKGTEIVLTLPGNVSTTGGNSSIKDWCFSDKIYTDCSRNGGSIRLTFDEDISSQDEINVYLSRQFTISGTTGTSTAAQVDATWDGVTIVNDNTNSDTNKLFTVLAKPTAVISGNSITRSNVNAGEYADYEFKFKLDSALTKDDHFEVYFPPAIFDPFVGNSGAWFMNEPSTYYLHCSSSSLSSIWCTVDKWKVTVMHNTASQIDADTEISFTIKYVSNPAAATAANTTTATFIFKWF